MKLAFIKWTVNNKDAVEIGSLFAGIFRCSGITFGAVPNGTMTGNKIGCLIEPLLCIGGIGTQTNHKLVSVGKHCAE